MNKFIEELNEDGVELTDYTQESSSGSYEPPAEGRHLARFVGYVELGLQPQRPYKGQAKDPAPEARFTFELVSPNDLYEVEKDGEKVTVGKTFRLNSMPIKTGSKAKYRKLFNKMQGGREEITTPAQMLGEAFIIEIVHNKVEDKVYANMNKDGEWLIKRPVIEEIDDATGDVNLKDISEKIPQGSFLQCFLFDTPTLAQWESIFIDGTYTKKNEAGEEEEVSKNFIQETIKDALNYNGSAIAGLLEEATEKPKAKKKTTTKAKKAEKVEEPEVEIEEAVEEDDDPIAALGLA